MNELLATIRLIAELTQAAEKISNILGSENRELTEDELLVLKARKDAAMSDWERELDRLRGESDV